MNDSHLQPETIERYRQKRLTPEEMLLVTTHLAVCVDCRALTVPPRETNRLMAALGPEHLSFEQLEGIARGGSVDEAEWHLESCEMCAEELADLKSFRTSLEARPVKKAAAWSRFLIPVGAFAVAAVVFWGIHSGRPTEKVPVVQGKGPASLATIRDRGGDIVLDASGVWHGLDGVAGQERDAALTALRTGELPKPVNLRDVARSRETLLSGSTSVREALAVEAPLGTVVLSDRPTFRWKAPKQASRFKVSVFDLDFSQVTSSPSLQSTEWQPAQPLARDRVYIWTVTANIAGAAVTAPKSPEPEARFRVASSIDAAALESVGAQSELAFALAAWKLGMKDDARAAIGRLSAQNPGSAEIARVASGMGAARQP